MKVKLTIREHRAIAKQLDALKAKLADIEQMVDRAYARHSAIVRRVRKAATMLDRFHGALADRFTDDYPGQPQPHATLAAKEFQQTPGQRPQVHQIESNNA